MQDSQINMYGKGAVRLRDIRGLKEPELACIEPKGAAMLAYWAVKLSDKLCASVSVILDQLSRGCQKSFLNFGQLKFVASRTVTLAKDTGDRL